VLRLLLVGQKPNLTLVVNMGLTMALSMRSFSVEFTISSNSVIIFLSAVIHFAVSWYLA